MLLLNPTQSPDQWPAPGSAYEAEALRFCRQWQTGQTDFVLHTSGSTGPPKPIRLTRAQMLASAHLTGAALSLQPGDRALICLNVRYVAGVMMLVRGLELALPMTIIEPTTQLLAALPAGCRFDFTALVPLQLEALLADNERGRDLLNPMKAILVGGAATGLALEKAVQTLTAPVWATYGMTETVSHIALRRLNGPAASDWFAALPGVTLGLDARGCLHISSAATNFDRVQTNDLAELRADGRFRLLGRADSVINTGGVKVSPEAVERVIGRVLAERGLPAVRFFVAGLPDDRLGQRVTVFSEQLSVNSEELTVKNEELTAKNEKRKTKNEELSIKNDSYITDNELLNLVQEAIREEIGPYAVPREWRVVGRFAETPTGKIDRVATLKQAPILLY